MKKVVHIFWSLTFGGIETMLTYLMCMINNKFSLLLFVYSFFRHSLYNRIVSFNPKYKASQINACPIETSSSHGIRFKVNNEDWLSVKIAFFLSLSERRKSLSLLGK